MRALIFIIALVLGLTHARDRNCQNGGVKILTRNSTAPYELTYQCLCPFNYYGVSCASYRGLLCYFKNERVLGYNPQKSKEVTLQFEMQCFLHKIQNRQEVKTNNQTSNYYKLPLSQADIRADLQLQNYNADYNTSIVWANDTALFDDFTYELIRNGTDSSTDSSTDQEILNSYKHYEFTTSKQFYGMPQFSSSISYTLKVVKFVKPVQSQVKFDSINTHLSIDNRTLIGRLNLSLDPSWAEDYVTRLQLTMSENYGPGEKIIHRVNTKSARWRLVKPRYPRGPTIRGDLNKVPGSLWVLLALCGLGAGVGGGRVLVKMYRKWRASKQARELNEQPENEE